MRTLTRLTVTGLLTGIFGVFSSTAYAQCKWGMYIDEVGMWGPYYDACAGEMTTTFDYNVAALGTYPLIWCAVDNTPYSVYYYAAELCPDPPCSGSVVVYTHCFTVEDHRLKMDVQTGANPEQIGFVYPWKLTAQYHNYTPQ